MKGCKRNAHCMVVQEIMLWSESISTNGKLFFNLNSDWALIVGNF